MSKRGASGGPAPEEQSSEQMTEQPVAPDASSAATGSHGPRRQRRLRPEPIWRAKRLNKLRSRHRRPLRSPLSDQNVVCDFYSDGIYSGGARDRSTAKT